MKICRICNLNETLTVFEYNRRICICCRKKQQKQYKKQWKSKNVQKVKEDSRIYYLINKDKIDKRNINYYFNNKDRVKITRRKYKDRNRQELIKKKKEKLKNDIHFKLSLNLRSRINSAIKRKNNKKNTKTTKLISCDIPFLKCYLECKFLPTMTWENYGKYWHIDHIVPCRVFDFKNEIEQRACFHYTNLRPLFAVTQIIDGVEYIGNINKG